MRKILLSVDGVSEFKRNWFNDDRYCFSFHGIKCIVNEPWGDNDQYWIGPIDPDSSLDMSPIHSAFRAFQFRYTFDSEFRK